MSLNSESSATKSRSDCRCKSGIEVDGMETRFMCIMFSNKRQPCVKSFPSAATNITWSSRRTRAPEFIWNVMTDATKIFYIVLQRSAIQTKLIIYSRFARGMKRRWKNNLRSKSDLFSTVVLQPLRWRCAECAVHHEWNVREEQHPYTVYVARTSNNRVIAAHDLYCCLLPQCEALRTCRSGFPIAM